MLVKLEAEHLITYVEESDFDVKGYYVAKEAEYLRVIKTVNQHFISHHLNINIGPYEFDIDIELKDIKYYFIDKIESNTVRAAVIILTF
jgi:hypothetical protein